MKAGIQKEKPTKSANPKATAPKIENKKTTEKGKEKK